MAFDLGPEPHHPACPSCKRPVTDDDAATRLVFREDQSGWLGFSGLWHDLCSRPYWEKAARIMGRLDG
ncbi:hypothetical protein [Caulobacter sp. 17J80-11]|uniref:hypothetical protein n=1 Tax=Caulobacter sp. 17J80-11 TaxID=2763502 RepID=UPI001653A14B|nr:hypothetical protein [Caulobacter sp. 17J80-11]MBC6981220.1 hypothetical protein [Caulobacter sp. 17J80-11]